MNDFTDSAFEPAESFLVDISPNDVYDEQVYETGAEARLTISSSRVAVSQKGTKYINVLLTPEDPYYSDINHMMMLPTGENPKADNRRKKDIISFCNAFGLRMPVDFNSPELKGAQAWAILKKEDDPVYGPRNRVKSWVVSK